MGLFLNLLFPTRCQVCGLSGSPVCATCTPEAAPTWVSSAGLQILALSELSGSTAAILKGFKDQNLVALKPYLANLIRESQSELAKLGFSTVVVPPRNPKNFAKRGFDPALDLARLGFGKNFPLAAMKLSRRVADQRSLTRMEREANIAGSFTLKTRLQGPVLIFDDVMTTGATLREMRRALDAAGIEIAGACVLAQRI